MRHRWRPIVGGSAARRDRMVNMNPWDGRNGMNFEKFPTAADTDGVERPMLVAIDTKRPDAKYESHGRQMAGGRVERVIDQHRFDPEAGTPLGWVFVLDDGRLYATPDMPAMDGPRELSYARMRWVGGFKSRNEAVAYLRGHRDAGSDFWRDMKTNEPRVIAVHGEPS